MCELVGEVKGALRARSLLFLGPGRGSPSSVSKGSGIKAQKNDRND